MSKYSQSLEIDAAILDSGMLTWIDMQHAFHDDKLGSNFIFVKFANENKQNSPISITCCRSKIAFLRPNSMRGLLNYRDLL